MAQTLPSQPHPSQTQPVQSLSHPEARTPRPADSADPDHHVPGSMDISEQEATFHRFMRLVTRAGLAIVVILLLLALFNA